VNKIETAFITGAASGIGKALAEQLASEGVALYLTDWNEEGLKGVADALKAKQANIHFRKLDVSDKDGVYGAISDAEQKLGFIDATFNNAGVSLSDTVEKMEDADLEWMMNINFWGVVHGTKASLQGMLKRGKGHIINISSIFGIIGVPSQSAYCAAKHAVKGFNESLHYELDGTGVEVHSVHPGGVDTGIVRHGRHKNNKDGVLTTEEIQERFKEQAITTPKEAAAIIIDGVKNSRYRILVGKDARMIDRLQRWLPNWWRGYFRKNMEKRAL